MDYPGTGKGFSGDADHDAEHGGATVKDLRLS